MLESVEWLSENLDRVRLLDVRGEVAPDEPRYRAHPDRYREGHLPGAVFADWRQDFTDREAAVPVTIAPPGVFAADATRLGIGAGTTVIAYDDYYNALAGRIVWALRSYGHDDARRAGRRTAGLDRRRRCARVRRRPAGPGQTALPSARRGWRG